MDGGGQDQSHFAGTDLKADRTDAGARGTRSPGAKGENAAFIRIIGTRRRIPLGSCSLPFRKPPPLASVVAPENISAHGFWYCEAYSVAHEEQRTFRVDRFEQIEGMDEPVDALEKIRREKGNHRSHSESSIRIVARLTYRGALLAEQDEHIGEYVRQVSEDVWEVDFMCPAAEWRWAVRFFYTLGLDAEVIEPESLCNEIFEIARQVSERYRLKP